MCCCSFLWGYFSPCSGIPANPSAARSCLPSASHFSLSFRSFSPCAQPISTISSRTLQARQSDTSWQSMPQKSCRSLPQWKGTHPALHHHSRGVLFRPAVCFRLLLGTPAVAHILLFNTFTTASFNMINPSVFKKILVFSDALILADLLIKRKILGNL